MSCSETALTRKRLVPAGFSVHYISDVLGEAMFGRMWITGRTDPTPQPVACDSSLPFGTGDNAEWRARTAEDNTERGDGVNA